MIVSNKNKRFVARFILCLMTMIYLSAMCFSIAVSAIPPSLAAEDKEVEYAGEYTGKEADKYIKAIEDGKLDERYRGSIQSGSKGDGDSTSWYKITGSETGDYSGTTYFVKRDKMSKVISAATNAGIENLVSEIPFEADTATAAEMLAPLQNLLSTVVGILAYVVVFALPIFTAIDVCYITIPVFREKAESLKNSGGAIGNMANKPMKDGSTGLRFISDEAQYAVTSGNVAEGKSPLKLYLTKRIGAFVMLAVVLYILIGGQVNTIVRLAINLVSGVMSALGGLGGAG